MQATCQNVIDKPVTIDIFFCMCIEFIFETSKVNFQINNFAQK